MRQYSANAPEDERFRGLTDLIYANAKEAPHDAVFSRRVGGEWQDVTTTAFLQAVVEVARGLVATGIMPGDRVALLCRTRYEWPLVNFAVWAVRAVLVPVYPTASVEQLRWVLGDSGAVAVVVETAEDAEKVAAARTGLPGLSHVWRLDAGVLGQLTEAGRYLDPNAVNELRLAATPDDTATITYTSGTSGMPKGCTLTHGNFLRETQTAMGAVEPLLERMRELGEPRCTLLFVPLAHVLGHVVQIGCVRARVRVGHTPDTSALSADLADFRPTFLLAVPYVLERLVGAARRRAEEAGRAKAFDGAVAVAAANGRTRGRLGRWDRIRYAAYDRLVYNKIRAALGGRLRFVLTGGASLAPRLHHFFQGIDIRVLEGYGLTETTAAITLNTPAHTRAGTVGRPLPGVTIGISDDGEVLVKGEHVFRGYWRNAAATDAAFIDGWFATGDLGRLDDDGYLTITGRRKELIVTSGGTNVAPVAVEDHLRAHPLISQAMVVGDNRPYPAALITLDAEYLEYWKIVNRKPLSATPAELAADRELLAELQQAVDAANLAVSRLESVRAFRVLDRDFTVDNGYLTPSLKLRRTAIETDFAAAIAALYR
ncbi:AMP-dependent synthetase/ligase [Allonocardiopsis opalescens]|uniref:Long-chain acyl-CoA synthetase n=1 Tax=Allonocardiopsis opalescens TaxID=1144618 RepID=A0A2T0Q531_9ACTN|nr:AMP-dependent synthetase/ligase [Allonocardiopsis opalescens]PRX98879.1 long-chain acyl-CoA synthetase [Allonocardiopsis opalescens]